jgi:type IV pilus assembly protein PilM
MFGSKRILCLNIGSHNVTLAEFSVSGGDPELLNYVVRPLGIEPGDDIGRALAISEAVGNAMATQHIKPGPLNVAISGQVVFPRFVKLPPLAGDRIEQIVQYEAEQNVPFPIDEVVWDYQLIDTGEAEQSAMLVAVKSEIVEELTSAIEDAGLEPDIVDVAPLALHNATAYNYADTGECVTVLDIGARSTNLVFIEGPRVFSRSIPVAGNAITQELMKEFNLSFQDAEDLKIEKSTVGQGGAVGSSGDDIADQVSKNVRSVMTRLHAEINRSINFYRGQQGGSAPARVLLTGGSSVISDMDTFFSEKLGLEVEMLNPFREVPVADTIDGEQIERDVSLLGEVVGLALRRTPHSPSEINLMPRELVARKAFRGRIPFFAVATIAVIAAVVLWWAHFGRLAESMGRREAAIEEKIGAVRKDEQNLTRARKKSTIAYEKAQILMDLIHSRAGVSRVVGEIRSRLLDGMWLTAIEPEYDESRTKIRAMFITGYGYADRLKKYDAGGGNPIEHFRDQLRESELFKADGTEVRNQGMVEGDFARQFQIRVALETPMPAW